MNILFVLIFALFLFEEHSRKILTKHYAKFSYQHFSFWLLLEDHEWNVKFHWNWGYPIRLEVYSVFLSAIFRLWNGSRKYFKSDINFVFLIGVGTSKRFFRRGTTNKSFSRKVEFGHLINWQIVTDFFVWVSESIRSKVCRALSTDIWKCNVLVESEFWPS